MKILLYCTKAKPYLADFKGEYQTYSNGKELDELFDKGFNPNDIMNILNGKIVAECDFEVEDLRIVDDDPLGAYWYETKTLSENEVLEKSCLTGDELFDYLGEDNEGYVIHIKNLHIFDKSRELSDYLTWNWVEYSSGPVYAIPQKPITRLTKMISVTSLIYDSGDFAIPVSPQEMCRIANGEQTALVRRRVLKEMLE